MQSLFLGLAIALILTTIGLVILATRTFYPRHRLVSFLFLLTGGTIFLYEFSVIRKLIIREERIWINIFSEYSLYAFATLGGLFFLYIFSKFIFREPSPLKNLTPSEIAELISQDEQNLLYLNQTLEKLAAKSTSWKSLHPSELSPTRKAKLKAQWQQFVEASFELDLIKLRYRAFYSIDMLKNPTLHTNCFVMAYAALVAQHRNIFCLNKNLKDNNNLVTFLNLEDPELGLPKNIYNHLKFRLTQTKSLIRLNAGRAYLSLLPPNEKQNQALIDLIYQSLKYLNERMTALPKMMLLNPVEVVEQRAFQAWYPIQKKAIERLSYIRASRRDYLITPQTLKPYLNKFKPGDIMLQRREWRAINLGIPGYWTHLAFYTGSLGEIEATFKDLPLFENQSPKQYLKEKYSQSFAQMNHKVGRFVPTVIEAKRPGVIISNVEESALCDSLAVLRPKVSRLDKFKAIEYAFASVGKPYDYTFDFQNDKALLCSELIYKGYQGAYGFNLVTDLVNGRLLFPPNKLAQKFDKERDQQNELEFVLYLEGNEKTHKVKSQTENKFRSTWKKPKWYIVRRYTSTHFKT